HQPISPRPALCGARVDVSGIELENRYSNSKTKLTNFSLRYLRVPDIAALRWPGGSSSRFNRSVHIIAKIQPEAPNGTLQLGLCSVVSFHHEFNTKPRLWRHCFTFSRAALDRFRRRFRHACACPLRIELRNCRNRVSAQDRTTHLDDLAQTLSVDLDHL